jgi:hypothetical protein
MTEIPTELTKGTNGDNLKFLGRLNWRKEKDKPGGTVGYPIQPRLFCLSVCESVSHISFSYIVENCSGPTDWVKYSIKM